jgi:hypothetical protein
MTNTHDGLFDLWQSISEFQNERISAQGQMKKNDHHFWNKFLHKLDNAANQGLVDLIKTVHQARPETITKAQLQTILEVQGILHQQYSKPRVLDHAEHKPLNWKFLMTLREIWNQVHKSNEQNKNNFNNLFD